ncbi:MAG: FtsX-like permease family protein [Betaproteobacteria bacterium]|nr:FtsX-like permease family protein [Betaproteobacteria bacterium]
MNRIRLASRMLRRNWQAGESSVLLFALFIAVASVTTVGFFADRVEQALKLQANELIGGDLVIVSRNPIPTDFRDLARTLPLTRATTATFPSMVSAEEGGATLGEIKAVSDGFPLRGKLRVSAGPGLPDRDADGAPPPGTVWVTEPLLAKINIAIGDKLNVGRASLKVTALITKEPDNVLDYFGVAPRIMINEADLPATALVQVGSRITYRMLLAGEPEVVEQFRLTAKPMLKAGQRIETVRDARSEVQVSLDRASRFLGLAALLSVILASVAVALAARRFSQRQMDHCAMMRCLGASQADIFLLNFYQFVMLAVLASLLGALAGYGAQAVLAKMLSGFFTVQLPTPGPLPALQGALTGFVLLLGFTVPPLLRLRSVPTLRVLRRDVGGLEGFSLSAYVLGLGALVGLIVWRAGDLKLGLLAVGGFAAALGAAALLGVLLIQAVSGLRGRIGGAFGGALRYGLANMKRRAGGSLVQIMALGLGIMAMLLLTLVRTDIISGWQASIPKDAPNRFVINIQADQLKAVQSYFAARNLVTPDLYPMVRGRLVEINAKPVNKEAYKDERARRLVEREFNMSFGEQRRPDNKIIAGEWWKPGDGSQAFSVEEGLAKTLGLKLGDSLTYEIGGNRFSAPITSLRQVDWGSFKPNFFVIASPGLIDNYPASYITSFSLPSGNERVVVDLVKLFPNLSVIDLSAIMAQVQTISDQVARAVEFVFLFALLAGLVVLYAAISTTQDERIFEGAIMRTLGAQRRQLVMLQTAEFFAIGVLAGLVAAGGAVGLGMVLSEQVLNVPYVINWWVPAIGLLAGAAGVTLAGLIGTRSTVNSPPLQTIRGVA